MKLKMENLDRRIEDSNDQNRRLREEAEARSRKEQNFLNRPPKVEDLKKPKKAIDAPSKNGNLSLFGK